MISGASDSDRAFGQVIVQVPWRDVLRCEYVVTQDGREAPLTPGDFALYDTRRPYQLSFDSEFRMFVVMFPRELLNLRPDDLANAVARRVSGRRGVGGLVSPFLVKLANELRSDQIVPTFELSNAVLDLFAAALSEQLGCESAVRPETRRHALILQIKAFIDARLDDPELTTATIAAAHYISPRYLQKLFEAEGSTVTDWIRRRRLDHCRRELLDPRHAGEPISRIAARWGLLDSSHFSRLFRATYGMSPREFRSEGSVPA